MKRHLNADIPTDIYLRHMIFGALGRISNSKKTYQYHSSATIPFQLHFKKEKMPDISNVRDLTHIFPNLIVKDILETDSLDKVNNFEATLEFTVKKSVGLYPNLW